MGPGCKLVISVWCGIANASMLISCASVAEPPARLSSAKHGSQEEGRIRQTLGAYAVARQRGDGPAQVAYYTEDAEFWHPRSGDPLYRGRVRIESLLAGEPAPLRLELVNMSFAAPDVALVDAHFFGTDPTPDGVAYYVMVKRRDEWLIRAVRIIPLPLPTPS